ncbi:MAG: PhzF family phenazine biosynthesis protein [Bacillota bacterium]|nr:PhzF family phenazine biosynthesis protein [Bacillota bacterium]
MKQYVVDAFTDKVFAGNPAAVCVMEKWLPDDVMQKIAIENNLSETAFAVKEGANYRLRWFTPGGEVELCGHATLATSFVIMNFIEPERTEVSYDTLSGTLTVFKNGELFVMDFPTCGLTACDISDGMEKAIGFKPLEVYEGDDMVCVLENEEQVRNAVPDQELIRALPGVCLHITARGKDYDCVTRTFAPKCNVTEDPVCGRAHAHIVSLWAEKLGKKELVAYQASQRGGVLYCRDEGSRTIISGKAALYAKSEIYLPEAVLARQAADPLLPPIRGV